MVHVPAEITVTVDPDNVQTPEVSDTNVTGRPEDADAVSGKGTALSVAPGMIDTGENPSSKTLKHFAEKTPMRRNGSAEDVAAAVLFFATAPHFITGQVLFVDGGLGL